MVSDFIDGEINDLKGKIEYGIEYYDGFNKEQLKLLQAIKLAKEALKTCEDMRDRNDYDKWFDSDLVDKALAAINALGKK